MTNTTAAVAHGLGEMLALVPYNLGFEPGRSVVAVLIRHGILRGCARVPAPTSGWEPVPLETWVATARGLRLGWVRDERRSAAAPDRSGDGAILISYDLCDERSRQGFSAFGAVCSSVGIPVLDTVVVTGDRWRLVGRQGGGRWQQVPPAHTVGAVSEYVALGVSPLPDRRMLAASYATDEVRAEPVAKALESMRSDRNPVNVERGLEAVTEWVRSPGVGVVGQSAASIAQGLHLLACPLWRDAMYTRAVPHLAAFLPSTTLEVAAHRRAPEMRADAAMLLAQVAPFAPQGHRAHLLALIALAEWNRGGGPRASTAVEACLHDDPGHVMGRFVLTCIDNGLGCDPAQWPHRGIEASTERRAWARQRCVRPAG